MTDKKYDSMLNNHEVVVLSYTSRFLNSELFEDSDLPYEYSHPRGPYSKGENKFSDNAMRALQGISLKMETKRQDPKFVARAIKRMEKAVSEKLLDKRVLNDYLTEYGSIVGGRK